MTLKNTPLNAEHINTGARMVEFAGWEMPIYYTSILEESRSVRKAAGIFDISHMGRVRLSGEGSAQTIQCMTSNNVNNLKSGMAQYSLITNPLGGVKDDIIVYCESHESYLLVINASNSAKDLDWIKFHQVQNTVIKDITEMSAMIAVQGPNAPDIVSKLLQSEQLLSIPRFYYALVKYQGAELTVCRTGYTGEDGFEIIAPASESNSLWSSLISSGCVPCGLGARDTLRIEAGYPLYGHEIDENISPVEAGLMWAVKLDKGSFIGKNALLEDKNSGLARRLMGLVLEDRVPPRQGYTIHHSNEVVGEVTSGAFSPTRGRSVAMGYITRGYDKVGSAVEIEIRGRRYPARIVNKKNLLV